MKKQAVAYILIVLAIFLFLSIVKLRLERIPVSHDDMKAAPQAPAETQEGPAGVAPKPSPPQPRAIVE